MFCRKHFDFQALDNIDCVKRLHFKGELGDSAADFPSHLPQFRLLYWVTDSFSGE